ncbi:SDR family NAD(P)-dependent oxidoreductase [Dactylosporangium sp. NPDC049525]|uniref:SDR family NAD(P)-dependent oxidoreductase n=1 Tax=Dactylosporangium sp. NPDC049525 TaxID=3154730 RepID=UPI0034130CB0
MTAARDILQGLQSGRLRLEDARRALAEPAPAATPAPDAVRPAVSGPEPIAIVGMSGRYPGAGDLDAYWDGLVEGRDAVREIPPSRWSSADEGGALYTRALGYLDDAEYFDPLFFGISPAEAEGIDPQHRIFLQEAYRAFEDAGYAPQSLSDRRCGVYLGLMSNEYSLLLQRHQVPAINITGNSGSIAAARLAYHLNLKGPAIAVDTACSSSLVATHLAIQALARREVDLALAGGVSLYLTPETYAGMCAAGMLSHDGRSKPFDDSADGFIPGEGVGAVVLKRLADAERDGDRIHAVIVGSGINQDGRTNGITAPSVSSQIELEREVYARAGIDPRTVSYVEMHGTGTKLGDPIELEALSKVYRERTADTGFCGIGSVKSNIGHTSAAAGVAGLHKVLLSLRHQRLVPTLHFQKPNEHFDFATSPFRVVTAVEPWPAGTVGPRRAAISSFGLSGTNAHLVVQEYRPAARTAQPDAPALTVLSARDDDRLREQATRLAGWLRRPEQAAVPLADVAYTLQVGRDAMASRLAIVAGSAAELADRLDAYAGGNPGADTATGRVRPGGDVPALFGDDEDVRALLAAWSRKGRLDRVAQAWVRGADVDWTALHTGRSPERVSAPTYPFARVRCWLPDEALHGTRPGPATAALGPLLHRNESTLWAQRYRAELTGDEFFLADHRIRGARVLPAVALVELAQAAVMAAADPDGGYDAHTLRLSQVVWARPVIVGDAPAAIAVELLPRDDDRLDVEIRELGGADPDDDADLYSRAVASVRPRTADRPRLDVAAIRAACTAAEVSGADCYDGFAALDMRYGPAMRALTALRTGDRQVLAQLELPAAATLDGYTLHPSLLDGALQACIGLVDGDGVAVPFAVDEVEIFAPVPARAWAWLRPSPGAAAGGAVQRNDIDVCDEDGAVCVTWRGLHVRKLSGPPASAAPEIDVRVPVWRPAPATQAAESAAGDAAVLVLSALDRAVTDRLRTRLGAGCQALDGLDGLDGALDARFGRAAAGLLGTVQGLLRDRPAGSALVQLVVPADGEQRLLGGLLSLLLAANLEHPWLRGQLVEVDAATAGDDALADLLTAERATRSDPHVRHSGGRRETVDWQPLPDHPAGDTVPLRPDGVYLITGGAGGLGPLVAEEFAARAPGATIVLTGRSPEGDAQRRALGRLHGAGVRAEYRSADVADPAATRGLVEAILGAHGRLDGVVHAAGVRRDGLLRDKTTDQLTEVLAAKVSGAVNLDAATATLPLDLFLVFGSLAGVAGNVGQADYAAANGFLDRFAEHRAGLVAEGRRHGRTVTIAWPLWTDGGMQPDEAAVAELNRRMGLVGLPTDAGMAALHRALASGAPRVLVLARQPGHATPPPRPAPRPAPAPAHGTALATPEQEGAPAERFEADLTRMAAELLKVSADELDGDTGLHEYGFDSIVFTRFSTLVNRAFGLELTPTVFFEYPTLRSLTAHLTQEYGDELAGHYGAAADTHPAAEPPAVTQAPAVPRRSRLRQTAAPAAASTAAAGPGAAEPIAIVGMSGAFPMAEDIDALWRNLLDGRDCIEEIPATRWDWRQYAGDDEPGGSGGARWAGILDSLDQFDPLFFGISPREAELMDPQQRLLMMHVWRAIEDAGHSAAGLEGSDLGLFIGTATSSYGQLVANAGRAGEGYSSAGLAASMGPNRMSYFLNIHGPSEPVETTCSSSLVALHRAVCAITLGHCSAAVVGGVNTIVEPIMHVGFAKQGMLSPNGRCRSFGAGADGYVRGEGVGMLYLRRLSDAERDGDHIYGVIRGTAENHGGRAQSLVAPNLRAQADLLTAAYRRAGVDPRTVGYIEAHGTGTALGDPIEVDALKSAFRELYRDRGAEPGPAHCAIGSVKSNIGHLELAAGVAGVIKVLLQMRHRTLVRSLHCDEVNPYVRLDGSPLHLQRSTSEWVAPRDEQGRELPRRAGVSSFGIGGVNAHVVLEEYVTPARRTPARPVYPIVLSARTEQRLDERVRQLSAALDAGEHTDADLPDLAYTLQAGRDAMDCRLAFTVRDTADLAARLRDWTAGRRDGVHTGHARRDRAELARHSEGDRDGGQSRAWLAEERYDALLPLWVKGLRVDWDALHEGTRPARLRLPTYPFATDRYWVSPRPAPADPAPATDRAEPAPVPAADRPEPGQGDGERTLLLHTVWEPLAPVTPPQAPAGRTVLAGGTPAQRDALRAAIADLGTLDLAPGDPVDDIAARLDGPDPIGRLIWCPPAGPADPALDEQTLTAARDGVHLTFRLVKALRRNGYGDRPLDLIVLTRGAQPTTAAQPARPGAAGIHGFVGVLAKEHPAWRVRLLDLDPGTDSGTDPGPDLAELLAVPADPQGGSVARRGGQWLRPRLLPVTGLAAEGPAYRPGGVYIVVGGAGGIGRVWTEHVQRTAGAQVVWVGRRPADDTIRAEQDRLARSGPRPDYISADAADRAQLERVRQEVLERHGAVHGVVHSAAATADRTVALLEEAELGVALRAKADVSVRIGEVFGRDELDFLLFFSSFASFVRLPGAAGYTAGSAVEDAVAHHLRRTAGYPVKVVHWGYWGTIGVGADATTQQTMRRMGQGVIAPAEAMRVLEQLLTGPVDELVMLRTAHRWPDGDSVVLPSRRARRAPRAGRGIAAGHAPAHVEPAPGRSVQAEVVRAAADVLGIDPSTVDVDMDLAESGFDRQALHELARVLQDGFHVPLPPPIFREATTLRRLADRIAGEHQLAGADAHRPTAAGMGT